MADNVELFPCKKCAGAGYKVIRVGKVVECTDCGGKGKVPDLTVRLAKRYGTDVPEGDGWSWDWETDALAQEAIDEIKYLRRVHAVAENIVKEHDYWGGDSPGELRAAIDHLRSALKRS